MSKAEGSDLITNSRNAAFDTHAGVFTKAFSCKRNPKDQALALKSLLSGYLRPDYSVLELGCGAGLLCEELSCLGVRTSGVDRSVQMIDLARGSSKKPAQVEWILVDFMISDFQLCADAVLLLYSILQTFPSRELQLMCIERALSFMQKGGLLLVECTNDPVLDMAYPAGKHFVSISGAWRIESWNEQFGSSGKTLHFSVTSTDDDNREPVLLRHKLRYCDVSTLDSLLRESGVEVMEWRDGLDYSRPLSGSSTSMLAVASRKR